MRMNGSILVRMFLSEKMELFWVVYRVMSSMRDVLTASMEVRENDMMRTKSAVMPIHRLFFFW